MSDSGFSSLEGAELFNDMVADLEMMARRSMEQSADDPTIDLQQLDLAIRPPSPIRSTCVSSNNRNNHCHGTNNHNSHSTDNKMAQISFEEIEFLSKEISKKSLYGAKLTDLMMENLKKTLGPETFSVFLKGGLPNTWLPIVKMNSLNCPYIEFLVKSDFADEAPESQLTNYTHKHLAYSQAIVDRIRRTADPKMLMESKKRFIKSSTPLKRPRQIEDPIAQRPQQQQQLQQPQQQQPKQRSRPKQQSKQQVSQELQLSQLDLNSSLRRNQPNRSCKSNSRYSSS